MFNLNLGVDVVPGHVGDLRAMASGSLSGRAAHGPGRRRLGRWVGQRLIGWGTSLGGVWPAPSACAAEGGAR